MNTAFKKMAFTVALGAFAATSQAQTTVMQPLTTFGPHGDGSLRAGDYPFLTGGSQLQRGLAYNPMTGHLLLVDRASNSVNTAVYVLDGVTGNVITNLDGSFFKLDRNSIVDGGNANFIMNLIGVADDGAIYVANLSNGTTVDNPQFRLYRWASETDLQQPVFGIGGSDPSNGDSNTFQKRWGDTLAVRGSGMNTQVIVANRGNLAALFTPDDGSFSHFTPKTLTTDVPLGGIGIGLTFGAGDTFWGTSGAVGNGPLYRIQFDANAGTTTTLNTLASSDFPGTISPILAMPASNLFAGITMVAGADVVRLYDVSNPATPVLLDRENFVTSNNNNTYSGSLTLGTNGVLYVLDADNGIMAFTLISAESNPLPPALFLNPASTTNLVGTAASFGAGADSSEPIQYQWYFGTTLLNDATNASLSLTNVQLVDAGSYSVVASNSLGSVTSSVAVLTVSTAPLTTLLAYDSFPYAVGSLAYTNGSWNLASGTNIAATIDAGSLVVPGLADSISNKLTWTGQNMSLRLTNNVTANTGSVYFSFAYQLDPSSTVPAAANLGGNGAIAGLASGNDSTFFPKICVQANPSGPGYNMAVFKRGATSYGGIATNVLALGETVFVVGRYTFRENTGNDDTVDLWVNPSSSTFGATNPPQSSVGEAGIVPLAGSPQNDGSNLTRFFFRSSGGPSKSYADDIRVGLTWADVTPPAVSTPPVPPTLNVVRNGSSITVSWAAEATGFTLEGTAVLSPANWVSIPYTNNSATINASSGNQFLRLRK